MTARRGEKQSNFDFASIPGGPASTEAASSAGTRQHAPATKPPAPEATRSSPAMIHASSPPNADAADQAAGSPASGGESAEAGAGLAGKTVLVVDAHSLVYQVFHAIAPMTAPDGQAVNAVFGLARDIFDLVERHAPDYLICAFDKSDITFRNSLYEAYKAHRKPMPDDLRSQMPLVHRVLDAMGVMTIEHEGFEADDIMATIAEQVAAQGGHCILVTNDKDCRQLIGDHVRLYNIRKQQFFDSQTLLDEWGIRPNQVVDFQAIVGDPVDNVPGIPTIGPKSASQLLAEFDSLEGIYQNVDRIAGKKREKIIAARDQVFLSRQLVELARDMPLEIDWSQARAGQFNVPAATAVFTELGFRSLAERVAKFQSPVAADTTSACHYEIIALHQLDEWVQSLGRHQLVGLQVQASSTRPTEADLCGLAMATASGEAAFLPVPGSESSERDRVLSQLRSLLENPAVLTVGHNLKSQLIVLEALGIRLAGPLFDTMVADYLIDPGRRNHNLDELSRRHLGLEKMTVDEGRGRGRSRTPDSAPAAIPGPYVAEEADYALRLQAVLAERLAEAELDPLMTEVEMPLVRVLAQMEADGIRVDTDVLRALSAEFAAEIDQRAQRIYAIAERTFNIDSPRQLGEILFDHLQLPARKRTATGKSTDWEVLVELAAVHPLPAEVIEYRQFVKLKSTYTDALLDLVNPRTGRVHTTFLQDVAATGRLSSKDPNLQNIPIRSETGRRIRQAFVAGPPDWLIMTADYSQIELRVLAHLSQDEKLLEAFAADEDIHAVVAAEIHHAALDAVTPQMRHAAKAINFGIIYGQSAFGLAQTLRIGKDQAAAYIDAYFARYPQVDELLNQILVQARRDGYVKTMLGRRRPIAGVRSESQIRHSRSRNQSERIAINTVIQGSAADLIKLAMLAVHRRLANRRDEARLLLQIHDELLWEVAPAAVPQVAREVTADMAAAMELSVPIKVDVEVGTSWGATRAWPPPADLSTGG